MGRYHKILEIDENCSLDEIKQAYRRLAKKYHPDLNAAPDAQQKFIEINEAYEVLVEEARHPYQPLNRPAENVQQEYNEFIHLVREQARKRARLRYEKFVRQQAQYRDSGMQDLVLLLKYMGRLILPAFGLFCISVPIWVCISERSFLPFLYLFFSWMIGVIIWINVYATRQQYFKLGSFYYSFKKIREVYQKTNESATESCFYCSGRKANSNPYIIYLLKVKDIKLKNRGPLQHQAGYDRENIEIKMPRSRKAFQMHSLTTVLKLCMILGCIFF